MGAKKFASPYGETHLREAAHRMKNHLAMIASMLRLEARHAEPDKAPEQFLAMARRVTTLATLYGQLDHATDHARLDLKPYMTDLVAQLRASMPTEKPSDITLEAEPCFVSADLAAELGLILTELATNAWKHGRGRDGRLSMRLTFTCRGKTGTLVCADRGDGLPDDYGENATLGMRIIRSLVAGISGTMMTETGETGATFTLRFPLR